MTRDTDLKPEKSTPLMILERLLWPLSHLGSIRDDLESHNQLKKMSPRIKHDIGIWDDI